MRSMLRPTRYAVWGVLLAGLGLVLASCADQHSKPTAQKPAEHKPVEHKPSGWSGGQLNELQTAYGEMLHAALPDLGSDDLAVRVRSQRAFEALCLASAAPGREGHRWAVCAAIIEHTGEKTPQPARVWLVRKLEQIGGAESVPCLAGLLNDKDIQVKDAARRALANNNTEAATAAIEAALRATPAVDVQWRTALVNALRGRALSNSQYALLGEMCTERNVVGLAAISLYYSMDRGKITSSGGKWLHERLDNFKAETDPPRREVMAAALLRAAAFMRGGQAGDDDAKTIYQAIANTEVNHATLVAALRGEAPGNSAKLFEIMLGDDTAFAAEAAAIAVENSALTGALVARLTDLPPAIQTEVIENLADRRAPEGLAGALKVWASSDDDTRCAATRAVGVLGSAAQLQKLIERAATTKGAEREAARWALARLPGRDVDAQLTQRIGGGDAGQRAEVIKAAGARNLKSSLPQVAAASSDANEDVRVAAYGVLGDLAGAAELPALVDRLASDTGDRSGPAAEDAVVTVANRVGEAEHRATPVLAKLEGTPAAGRPALIRALGRLGGDAALGQIRKSLANGGEGERDAAVRALAKWNDAAVLADLEQIAKATSDETHRSLALRGYFRLLKTVTDKTPDQRMEMVQRVLASARTLEDKKALLGALGEIKHPEALALASSSLNEEGLRDEAAMATASAARRLAVDQPQAARTALDKAREATLGENAKKAVNEAQEFLTKFVGYNGAWQYAGPYFQDGKDFKWVYDTAFDAEKPDAKDVKWQALPASNNANPFILDLTPVDKGANRCLYARSWVWSDRKQPARVETGSDDAIRVWFNGESVYGKYGQRSTTPGDDKIPVTLNEGWNQVLVKVVNSSGNWEFCCGVRGPNGEELSGLKFKAEP